MYDLMRQGRYDLMPALLTSRDGGGRGRSHP